MFHHLRLRGQCIDETAALKGDRCIDHTVDRAGLVCIGSRPLGSFLERKWDAPTQILISILSDDTSLDGCFSHFLTHALLSKAAPRERGQ